MKLVPRAKTEQPEVRRVGDDVLGHPIGEIICWCPRRGYRRKHCDRRLIRRGRWACGTSPGSASPTATEDGDGHRAEPPAARPPRRRVTNCAYLTAAPGHVGPIEREPVDPNGPGDILDLLFAGELEGVTGLRVVEGGAGDTDAAGLAQPSSRAATLTPSP